MAARTARTARTAGTARTARTAGIERTTPTSDSCGHLIHYLAEFDFRYSTRKMDDTGRTAKPVKRCGWIRVAYKLPKMSGRLGRCTSNACSK
jgi:hypothetical protein